MENFGSVIDDRVITTELEKAITFCLCGWNCFWLSLMPRLPVASFVIDRMSDGSIHFCGDVLTIKEH